MSTLHTNDAAGAITRLIDMGVEPFLISSTLVGVLGQRLIRRVCSACRAEYDPDDRELTLIRRTREDLVGHKLWRGRGCEMCNNTGYRGRVGIFELLSVSSDIQSMINRRVPTQSIRERAIEQGMQTMREDGIKQVLEGVTTVEEVLKHTSFA
jgi:type IV pilus assembly protein PilB